MRVIASCVVVWVTIAMFFSFDGCVVKNEKNSMETTEMQTDKLLDKADSVFKSGKYEESRDVYMQAMAEAENAKDNSGLTEAYSMVARTYLIVDKKEDGRPWIEKAQKIATPEEPLGWSRYLGVKGRFEWQDKHLEKATVTFKEMYDYCSKNKLHERAIDAAHMVAITGSHEQQIEWGLKGIEEAEAGNITGWLGPLWNNLGATYEGMGKYNESLDAYLKAREYHWRYGNEMNKLIADWAVGHAYRLTGNMEEAGRWLRPALAWSERIDAAEFIGWSHKELGEIELANGNYNAALDHLVIAEEKLKAEQMPDWDPDGYKKLIEQIERTRDRIK